MTLFFPDVNVWLALSVADHSHSGEAWHWLELLPPDARLIFSRFTQLGLLRLLTNAAVTGDSPLRLRRAWAVYDRWREDPRVDFYPEPHNLEVVFRRVTEPFAARPASKWVGDCWLLAYAIGVKASLVTFDRALYAFARKSGEPVAIPS